MANPNVEVKVSVEAAIMKGVKELAVKMRDEHNICIRAIDIDWMDVSAVGGNNSLISKITLVTTGTGD